MSQSDDKKALGRLTAFGLKEPWQVAMLLPTGWDDMRAPLKDFSEPILADSPYLVLGRQVGGPQVSFKHGKPRLSGALVDPNGHRIRFSKFGDTRDFEALLKKAGDSPVYLFGNLTTFNNQLWLNDPELVHPWWVGKYRPRYPGKTGVIGADLVRQRVLKLLKQSVPQVCAYLVKELVVFGGEKELAKMAGMSGWDIHDIIYRAHMPSVLDMGDEAQKAMETFAALGVLKQARNVGRKEGTAVPVGNWRERESGIPFALTDEQQKNVEGILAEVASATPLHGLLSGDVGFGKTAVYGLVAAAVADGGGKAAVLLPNETLAEQICNSDLRTWFPDLDIALVTGSAEAEIPEAQILVGTTALIHRIKDKAFDLVVVDEQQKFSRDQREALMSENTNLLEVSATPIPRTQALIRYNVVKVWHLTRAHKQKNFHTRIWYSFEKRELFQQVRWSLSEGHQVLVIYPLREQQPEEQGAEEALDDPGAIRSESDKEAAARSVMEAFEQWDRVFPGKVRALHGGMNSEEKRQVMEDMREDRANCLLATSIVEIGINLPRLRRVVVVHPDRYGLSQLHQIRGRAARLGGDGYFDLFVIRDNIKPATVERLEVLERTQNGFEVAEADMRIRGIGDLSKGSSKQSGADDTFLFGRPLRLEILDAVMKEVGQVDTPAPAPVPVRKDPGEKQNKSRPMSQQRTQEAKEPSTQPRPPEEKPAKQEPAAAPVAGEDGQFSLFGTPSGPQVRAFDPPNIGKKPKVGF